MAREVIPQPKPQPSLSQETRRCRQPHRRAVLRANLFSFSRYVHKERSDKSKPHCVARGRNRITFSNEKTRAAVAQSSRVVFAVSATAAFALIFERTCFVNISGDFPSSGLRTDPRAILNERCERDSLSDRMSLREFG